jgi:hypothetical protein
MNQSIIIVDNFYDIPHQYHKGFFENQCVITDETYKKLSNIVGNKIEIISSTNEVLGENDQTSVCAHLLSDCIAVIYLSLPLVSFGEFGMKFYSHRATGLETFPTKEEKIKYNLNDNNLKNVFSNNVELWKEYGNISAKYNRIILFRANRWHSYGKGFGYDLNTSMLYQKIILKNV